MTKKPIEPAIGHPIPGKWPTPPFPPKEVKPDPTG